MLFIIKFLRLKQSHQPKHIFTTIHNTMQCTTYFIGYTQNLQNFGNTIVIFESWSRTSAVGWLKKVELKKKTIVFLASF